MGVTNCLFEHDVIDAKLLAEENGTLTMTNNGTGDCIVTLLNPFKEQRIYLDDFWTTAVSTPVRFYDQTGLALSFTKFDDVGEFFLQDNFYRIFVPVGASFTVVGYDSELNK